MAKRLGPASNTDRGRASRLRAARDGEAGITRADARWLERYERDRAKAAEQRTEKRARAAKTPPKVRARTNTERGRASRLRSKERDGAPLTKSERRFLEQYARATKAAQRGRASSRAKTRKRSAQGDADDVALRLAAWLQSGGLDSDAGRAEAPVEHGARKRGARHAYATVQLEAAPIGGRTESVPPDLAGALGRGRAMSVRVLLTQRGGKERWATILAYSDLAGGTAEGDLWEAMVDAQEAYAATGVSAVAVVVGGYA